MLASLRSITSASVRFSSENQCWQASIDESLKDMNAAAESPIPDVVAWSEDGTYFVGQDLGGVGRLVLAHTQIGGLPVAFDLAHRNYRG